MTTLSEIPAAEPQTLLSQRVRATQHRGGIEDALLSIPEKLPPERRWVIRFPDGELEIGLEGKAPAWFEAVVRGIGKLAAHEPNWDGYGSPPLHPNAAQAALLLLLRTLGPGDPAPAVFPTCAGGISLEWNHEDLDLEVEMTPDPRVLVLLVDHRCPERSWERELDADLEPLQNVMRRLAPRA